MIALSSSLCPTPSPPRQLLEHWKTRRRETALALALDRRLPPAVQRELVELSLPGGVLVRELAVPGETAPRRPAPRATSADRGERRAATELWRELVAFAASRGVVRLVASPEPLDLSTDSIEALRRRFACAEPLELEALEDERAARAQPALDGWRGLLDGVLKQATDLGVTLAFLTPTVWPHQCPNGEELGRLAEEFAGARLGTVHATDWAHARSALLGEPATSAPTPAPLFASTASGLWLPLPASAPAASPAPSQRAASPTAPHDSARLADACGLRLRLPLGTGELPLPAALEHLPETGDRVLTFDTACTAAEVERSLGLLA
ncbi:MAG: hypothetical protein IT371_20260 [Deltaproteobacteria bacterium]|nr:hypothetical protein [Deltaproteobacteria bacterium]